MNMLESGMGKTKPCFVISSNPRLFQTDFPGSSIPAVLTLSCLEKSQGLLYKYLHV